MIISDDHKEETRHMHKLSTVGLLWLTVLDFPLSVVAIAFRPSLSLSYSHCINSALTATGRMSHSTVRPPGIIESAQMEREHQARFDIWSSRLHQLVCICKRVCTGVRAMALIDGPSEGSSRMSTGLDARPRTWYVNRACFCSSLS